MPYKDPGLQAASKRKYWLAHRVEINAKSREKWPQTYARSREKRLTYNRSKATKASGWRKPLTCEACGDPAYGKALHLDHCHKRGHFRGWLCQHCNYALGHLKDDPMRIRKLLAYIERTKHAASSQLTLPGL